MSDLNYNPVLPTLLTGETQLQFRCHPAINCFNACCKNIDITLTPYDILRLSRNLKISSGDFLTRYTFPYELEKDGLVGVKLRPIEHSTVCQFMNENGCGVYSERPTACRYYPLALLALRHQEEYTDRNSYALVREDHCLGHHEPRNLTIDEYRHEQGLAPYDELDRGWRQLILKKKSSGPTVGKPSPRSLQLFFLVCYDLDRFRQFLMMPGFQDIYDLPPELWEQIQLDDIALMLFGFRFLRQVLFNEVSINLKTDAMERRNARKQEREVMMNAIAQKIVPLTDTE